MAEPARNVPAPVRGALVSFRNDRLGARLLSLVNAMRIGADHGLPFVVHWPFAVDVTRVFNDPTELFDDAFVDRHFIDRDVFLMLRPKAARIGDVVRENAGRLRAGAAAGRNVLVDQAFGINVLAGEDRATVTARFAETFGRVPFSAALQGPMARIDGALRGATAYHIRRGDLTAGLQARNKAWPHKMVPDEFYERHMERALGGGAAAILFSDDAPTLTHYTSVFPKLRTIHDVVDTGSLTEAQRDFVELYAMSRCATIVAPERSAFSSTAAELSGARKLSVTEALSPGDREAAMAALHARLRDRPESFANDGEIGQSLAHVGQWLEGAGRWEEAAALFAARVGAGLDISFVYPMTMTYQHRAGDLAGALRTARQMNARPVVHLKDQASAEILHGLAHLRLGDREAGLRHVANGFWHAPSVAPSRTVVPFLVANGMLNARNFLPATAFQLSLVGRRGPLKALFSEFPDLVRMEGVRIPPALGAMEPVIWDWAPLMRSVSVAAEVRRGTVARFAEVLAAKPDVPGTEAERASMAALFAAFRGDRDEAAEALSAAHPDDAMAAQRLAHVHWIARRFRDAAGTAQRAAELRPDWPAMRAFAGMTALRVRDYDAARAHLEAADAAGSGLASIPGLLADCLQRMGEDEAALAAVRRGLALAPLEADFAVRAARLLDDAGRPEEAIACLSPVVEAERAPAKVTVLLVELLHKTGDVARAAGLAREAAGRQPDHAAIADLAGRLAPVGIAND